MQKAYDKVQRLGLHVEDPLLVSLPSQEAAKEEPGPGVEPAEESKEELPKSAGESEEESSKQPDDENALPTEPNETSKASIPFDALERILMKVNTTFQDVVEEERKQTRALLDDRRISRESPETF